VLPLFGQNPRKFGRNQDVDILAVIEEGDFPIHTRINYRPVIAERDAASACHASQLEGGPPNRGPVSWLFRLLAGNDTYMRAHPEAARGLRERDLFEGVV
jgi:hypothetical protein